MNGAGVKLWGYDSTNKVWLPIEVDASGNLLVDLSGVNLDDLGDVSVATPVDLWIFYYDAGTALWKGRLLSSWTLAELGTKNLNDLDDVNIAAPADVDLIYWDLANNEYRSTSLASYLTTLLTTRGDILRMGAALAERYAIGAAGTYLRAGALDPTWAVPTFLELSDTPAAYAGFGLHGLRVNAAANAVEFLDGIYESGATLPAAPVAGLRFLHTPAGRNILYVYDGTNWIPLISFGTMTVYIDKTDGTDDLNHGHGLNADAFQTVQFAVNTIPGLFGGNVVINLNNETYTEDVTIQGKYATGSYTITLQGVLTTLDSLTAAASVQGTGATQGTVVRNAGTWTLNQRQNKLVRFTSGVNNGVSRIIDSNIAGNTLTIVGTWPNGAPGAGDTFVVEDWATTINGWLTLMPDQIAVVANDCFILHVLTYRNSHIVLARCKTNDFNYVPGGQVDLHQCFCSGALYYIFGPNYLGLINCYRSKLQPSSSGVWACFDLAYSSVLNIQAGSILDGVAGVAWGIRARINSTVACWSAAADGYVRIRNFATAGIRAESGSMVIETANNQYAGNLANETAVAASYGYID